MTATTMPQVETLANGRRRVYPEPDAARLIGRIAEERRRARKLRVALAAAALLIAAQWVALAILGAKAA